MKDEQQPEAKTTPALPRVGWVSTLYFAEGLPYMIVRFLGGVFLTDLGVKEAYIGFLNFLGIPWNLKFLWAPAVDFWGNKRNWVLICEGLIGVGTVGLGLLAWYATNGPGTAIAPGGELTLTWFFILLAVLAFLAATHDISIDSYYLEAITDTTEQARYTGLRVMTYRLAIVFARGGLVATAAWLGWMGSYLVAAGVMTGLTVLHYRYLPIVPNNSMVAGRAGESQLKTTLRNYLRAFLTYAAQPRSGIILAFVILYKLGDEIMFSMNSTFLMRELKVEKETLAWMSGVVGMAASIGGSLVSAWAIRRWGFWKAVWPLTLGMNLNIWAYIFLAWFIPDSSTSEGLFLITFIHSYEQFAAGLGNAVLVVYIMTTCNPEFKAAHYALATAVSSLGGTLVGGFGGVIAGSVGYVNLFLISFAASIPAMALILFLPRPDQGRSGK